MPKFSPVVALISLVLVFLVLATPEASAQYDTRGRTQSPKLFTQTSIEKVWQTATQKQQPMLVMFTSDNCRFCKKMLAETYGHPGIQQMLTGRTQTVLAHSDDYKSLIKRLGIRGYPTTVLISPKGDVLDLMQGYLPPKEFAQRVSPLLRTQVAKKVDRK